MAVRIRVTSLEGSPISAQRAWLRSSVDVFSDVLSIVAFAIVCLGWTGPEWSTLDWVKREQLIQERMRLNALSWVLVACFWSERFVMLFNRRRRALHDFVAGTVVVKLPPRSTGPSAATT